MIHKKEGWAVLIGIVAATAVLVYFAARTIGQVLAFGNEQTLAAADANPLAGVDTSGWQTYRNDQFGFSLKYPPGWQMYSGGQGGPAVFIGLGNPLSDTAAYGIKIFVQQNPQALSSGEYVHQMLSADKAEDEKWAIHAGQAQASPVFEKSFLLTIGSYPAYELYGVDEFFYSTEQIYIAHGTSVLYFDFPVSDGNPSSASIANNNAIAHMIMGTLMLK